MRCKDTPKGGVSGGSLPVKRMKQLSGQTSCFTLTRTLKELFVKVDNGGKADGSRVHK
jgi:hypothetical protein